MLSSQAAAAPFVSLNPPAYASRMEPMLPTLVQFPFSNPDWLFEPKWDGFRAICFIENGTVRFISRRQNDLTRKFPSLQKIAKSIKANVAVMDGEIVALDKSGTVSQPRGVRFKRRQRPLISPIRN